MKNPFRKRTLILDRIFADPETDTNSLLYTTWRDTELYYSLCRYKRIFVEEVRSDPISWAFILGLNVGGIAFVFGMFILYPIVQTIKAALWIGL